MITQENKKSDQTYEFEKKDLSYFMKTLNDNYPYLSTEYNIKYIGIFGSYVKGEETKDSDLDILVEFSKTPGLFKLIKCENYLTSLLGVKVDLVLKNTVKPYIGKRILEEVVSV